MQDNLRNINLLDYANLRASDNDWSASFVAALAVAVSTGYPLYIPGGVYPIAPVVIPDNTSIIGVGTLKLMDGALGVLLTLGNKVNIFNLTLDGNNLAVFGGNWYPVSINSKNDITLKDVTILNALTDAVHISGVTSDHIRLSGVQISNFTGNGINITSGANIQITDSRIFDPTNAAAPGNGIALISDGNPITDVTISNVTILRTKGEGIAVTGIGTRNVTDVTVNNVHVTGSALSGIRATFAERILISDSVFKSNTSDGVRLRGDVRFCRVSNCAAVNNTGVGMEEVVSGASPNNNTFSFNVLSGNVGGDTVIKVGAGSIVV